MCTYAWVDLLMNQGLTTTLTMLRMHLTFLICEHQTLKRLKKERNLKKQKSKKALAHLHKLSDSNVEKSGKITGGKKKKSPGNHRIQSVFTWWSKKSVPLSEQRFSDMTTYLIKFSRAGITVCVPSFENGLGYKLRGINKVSGKYFVWKIFTVWIRPDCAAPKITFGEVALKQISVRTCLSIL